MSLTPLLTAPLAIQVHAYAAMVAFVLGIIQLAAPKGTLPHRTIGWTWVGLILVVCVTAFFIHEIRLVGPWSPIHLLAIMTPIWMIAALRHARRHERDRHGRAMTVIFFGALVVAGAFTFFPGRIMYEVTLGP